VCLWFESVLRHHPLTAVFLPRGFPSSSPDPFRTAFQRTGRHKPVPDWMVSRGQREGGHCVRGLLVHIGRWE